MNKDACRPRQDECPRSPGVPAKPARDGWLGRQGVALAWAGGGRGRRCGAAVWLHREGRTGVRARRLTQAAERHGRAGGSRAWTPPPTSGAGSPHRRAPELGAGRRAAGACPRGWVGVGRAASPTWWLDRGCHRLWEWAGAPEGRPTAWPRPRQSAASRATAHLGRAPREGPVSSQRSAWTTETAAGLGSRWPAPEVSVN